MIEPMKVACLYYSPKVQAGLSSKVEGHLNTTLAGLACGEPNPIASQILKDRADYFAICPDYVAAMGMWVYGNLLKGDPVIISGESDAATLGALRYIS